ncbi:DnaJ-domain-containing protein [Rhizopogon vinicolor AM-OR11-026]|uniref:DnaJ-domain-containing protein n=1 Tax=Rhizopogon vinicolor AM-OR11-026 TaxID=1314800 RepID=A0A1B7MJP5_9AGAM|nr:DnaJ-domain-containing protein [Rhizopogon vinicolor AM-OR11-026]
MATNLYETLGLSRDATPEQIRKAYRRKALETHPDRLQRGASPADKAASEEMFRKVNNAYEVLSDPENRRSYDQHGVWPPPTAQESYTQGNWQGPARDPFQDPSFYDPFAQHPFFGRPHQTDPFGFFGPSRHSHSHGFTDPFVLFNQIFGDFHQAFSRDPFDPFGHRDNDFFGGFMSPTSMLHMGNSPFGFPTGSNLNVYSSSSRGRHAGGQSGSKWISESHSTSTVNGVTYTKAVRRDSEGNEHVTYSYPDGTKRRLINGIEQPSYGSIPPPPQHNYNAIAPPPLVPTQGSPPPYDARSAPPPVSGSRHTPRDHYSRSRDYARQPQDPQSQYDPYSRQQQQAPPYASQYADPNASGYHHEHETYGGADEARERGGGASWRFWK